MIRCPYCHQTHETYRLGPFSVAACSQVSPDTFAVISTQEEQK